MRAVLCWVVWVVCCATAMAEAERVSPTPRDTPLDWRASWIWHPDAPSQDNLYLHVRKVITLSESPTAASVHVTAGSLYKLWINGQYVGRGPNPADPSFYYYDTHDVARLLKAGPNVIALTCYSYGSKPHGVIHQNYGPGGLLLEIRDQDGKTLAKTDDSWRILHAPEYDQQSSLNNTLYGDFKEVVDTRKEPLGWRDQVAFDDGQWKQAAVLGRPPQGPYPSLHPREIPFLTYQKVFPVDVFWESASVTYAWRDDWEFYHEHSLIPGSPMDRSGQPMEARKTHADFSPAVTFDFGKLVTGYPEISIQQSEGGIVDVLYGEDLHLTRVDRFTLRGGAQMLQPFGRRTFRYLKLVFPELPKPARIDRVCLNQSTFPVDSSASAFACSDPLLNRIYDAAKYTIAMSMLDHLVDCPGRERTFYGGDVYAESLCVLYAFGDPAIIRKTVRQNFAIQYEQGALPVAGPYSGFPGFYPSWSAFAGLALLDDYRYTGSRRLNEELWPGFARLMDFAIGQLEASPAYLVGEPAVGGPISQWVKGERVRFSAWGNFPYYVMLRRGAEMARVLGREAEAQRYDGAADRMQRSIREHFVGDDGLFATWPRSQPSDQPKAHENGLMVWSAALDTAASRRVVDELLKPAMPSSGSSFADLFIAQNAYEFAGAAKANEFVRRAWGEMLERGATTFWESYDASLPGPMRMSWMSSNCHGWAAGPVYLLPAYVLGVRPLEPGFAKVLIAPHTDGLEWAGGRVPTPKGPVSVRWSSQQGSLQLRCSTPVASTVQLAMPVSELVIDGVKVSPQSRDGITAMEVSAGDHVLECR